MSVPNDQDGKIEFAFLSRYRNLLDVLTDQELAALGDAYVNFIFSLARSKKLDKPTGEKVESSILASALRKANLRRMLPLRVDRHRQADAAEALIVYGWIRGKITLKESVNILEREDQPDEGFSTLLQTVLRRVEF